MCAGEASGAEDHDDSHLVDEDRSPRSPLVLQSGDSVVNQVFSSLPPVSVVDGDDATDPSDDTNTDQEMMNANCKLDMKSSGAASSQQRATSPATNNQQPPKTTGYHYGYHSNSSYSMQSSSYNYQNGRTPTGFRRGGGGGGGGGGGNGPRYGSASNAYARTNSWTNSSCNSSNNGDHNKSPHGIEKKIFNDGSAIFSCS